MANTITTMHIIIHTMWLMKFKIPMYFLIVDFSCNNETFIAKFFIVIIWRVDSCSINIFIYFYNNIITCEKKSYFVETSTGEFKSQLRPRGSYTIGPLLKTYTPYSPLPLLKSYTSSYLKHALTIYFFLS